jgi:integrase
MASISHDGNGFRRILFKSPITGKRDKIHLGKTSAKSAATILAHVEAIIESKELNRSLEPETASWLRGLGDEFYAKLAGKGLAPSRRAAGESILGTFITAYIAMRTDVKPSTVIHFERAKRELIEFFGADKPLADITEGDADEFRLTIRRRLGENTVRRICGRARQFFRAAIKRRLIVSNPFGEMKGINVMANKAREYFVSQADAAKVLDACPDAQWRLLFALSRYGGLRCPSEHLGLRWADVDWERGRLTIRSFKTERYEGKGERTIPIFPELRPHLEAVWEQAAPGTEYIITRYRDCNSNLRTQLNRIIARAGLSPWPKLFQNLRSTRETELAEKFPIHVVCQWIGNSQAVAAKHYLQTTDEHFETAQKTAQTVANSTGPKETSEQSKSKKCLPIISSPILSTCIVPLAGLEPAA